MLASVRKMITAPKIRAVGAAAIIGLFGVFTGPQTAEALLITENSVSFDVGDVGLMFDVSYVCANSSGAPVACPSRDLGDDPGQFNESGEDLIVNVWYEILTFDATTEMVTLRVTVENATAVSVDSELVSFGFDVVTPDLMDAEVTANNAPSPPDWEARLDAQQGGGLFQSVDICFIDSGTSGSDCNSAGGDGLSSDTTDVFDLKLTFDDLMDLVTLTTPTIKLAGIGGTQGSAQGGTIAEDSLEFTGTFLATDDEIRVPEPASLLLYGIGLLGLGVFARRRRRLAA